MAYHVFISYRRQGASELALLLYKHLSDDGYSPFLDVKGMHSGRFNSQLLERLEECTDVLVLLPENAFEHEATEEDWFCNEIAYALRAGKNVIPIMMQGFQWPKTKLPFGDELRYRQGVEANSKYYESMYQNICQLLSFQPGMFDKPNKFPLKLGIILAACAVLVAGVTGFLIGLGVRDAERVPPSAIIQPIPTATLCETTTSPSENPTHSPAPIDAHFFTQGDIVEFGVSGAELLRWQVLESNERITKLLSDECIASKPFGATNEWKESTLRSWLNQTFFYEAFDSTQRAAFRSVDGDWIRIPTVAEVTNPQYGYSPNRNAADLSRAALPNRTALEQGVWTDLSGYCTYYTMTPFSNVSMYRVHSDGRISGVEVNRSNVGIRIVITVETAALR